MKTYFVFSLLALLIILTGCQDQNRYSMHGSEIIQYQGDQDVLKNCCSAAMARLAEDIKKDKGLDSYPPMTEKTKGWTSQKVSSSDGTFKKTGQRMTLTCNDDGRQYRMEVIWLNDRPAMILIESPDDNAELLKHLVKLFSNFDVRLVDAF
jgi:hypothetical protein